MSLFPSRIPKDDDVYYKVHPEFTGVRKGLLSSLFCSHYPLTSHTLIDYRYGPGWMSDTYEMDVCLRCGRIVHERKVY